MGDNSIKSIIANTKDGKAMLILSKAIYERDAVFRTARKFNDKCTILVEPHEKSEIAVYLERKNGRQDDLKVVAGEFCNELINQQVLMECERKYKNIRDLIYEHAFSPLDKMD